MKETELKAQIDAMIADLVQLAKAEIGGQLESLTLTGSYATGRMTSAMPDINLFVFLNKPDATTYLKLGEIVTRLAKKYSKSFALRPEFRPFKFAHPLVEGEPQVVLNLNPANAAEKGGDFPFGASKHVLNGMAQMRKVIYGRDVFGETNLEFDRPYLIQAAFRDLGMFRSQLLRAPMAYNLERDNVLFFSESLICGKITMYLGVELAETEEELKSGKHLELIAQKRKMHDFYNERYGAAAAKAAQVILDARDNFAEWKGSKEKAYEVYKAAYELMAVVWAKLLQAAQR